jgi:hypothetical protein
VCGVLSCWGAGPGVARQRGVQARVPARGAGDRGARAGAGDCESASMCGTQGPRGPGRRVGARGRGPGALVGQGFR